MPAPQSSMPYKGLAAMDIPHTRAPVIDALLGGPVLYGTTFQVGNPPDSCFGQPFVITGGSQVVPFQCAPQV